MQAVSAQFLREVSGSHTRVAAVEILNASGEAVETITELVIDAPVTMNGTASIRSTLSMSMVDPDGRYRSTGRLGEPLSPFGTEVRVWSGVKHVDGTEEMVALGTFRIETNDDTEAHDGWTLAITGKDRSSVVSRKASSALAIPNGTPLEEAVRRIVVHMLPTATFELAPTNEYTPTMLIKAGDNPWDVAVALARVNGYSLYVDRMGVFRMDPSVLRAPSWAFLAGERNTLTAPSSVSNGRNTPVPNGFIVTSSSTGGDSTGIRGEAWDENPLSPTYRYGTYGELAEHVTSDKVTSNQAARQGAQLLLRRALGRIGERPFSAVCNPALDPDDVIYFEGAGGFTAYYLSQLTVPLLPSAPMTGTLRLLPDPTIPTDAEVAALLGGVDDGIEVRPWAVG